MNRKCWKPIGLMYAVVFVTALAMPAPAQNTNMEAKEKPRMYTYVAFWDLPRAQWAEWPKAQTADQKTLQDALSSGTLIGYGDDTNMIHQPDGPTHDDWFSSMSMAGLMNTLQQFYSSGGATTPMQEGATKHWDAIYVSRYYNWHPGSWQNVYSEGSSYKLKEDAPDNAIDVLANNAIVPVLEKMLANGTIHEYEIDTEAIHTQAPGTFWIFYVGASADALDKVGAAIRDSVKGNPLIGPSFGSMVDFKEHRDYLARTNATYK